jgi:hypothetical protein
LYVSPSNPSLEAVLQTELIESTSDDEHGYAVERRRESLYRPTLAVTTAGLAPIAQYWLMNRGHDVEMRLDIPDLEASRAQAGTGSNGHVMSLIHRRAQGLIRHGLNDDGLAEILIEIGRAFPETSIGIIAPTEEKAERLHRRMSEECPGITLGLRRRCLHPGQRVAVLSLHGLAHPDVWRERIDVLIFTNAAQALHEVSQLPLLGPRRFRLYGLLHRDVKLSPYQQDRLVATFGVDEETVPRLGYRERQIELAWMNICGGPHVPGHLRGLDLLQRGIQQHPVRNRQVAKLAKALVGNTPSVVARLCPAAASAVGNNSCRTIVATETLEHALAIAPSLPGWTLVTALNINTAGLSGEQQQMLAARRALFYDPTRAIATTAGLRRIDLDCVDAVIWAGGGGHLPAVPPDQLICPAAETRPLLLVDLDDKHHAHLRAASRQRREAYWAAGWFPVGMLPMIGRIRRFLAGRPGGDA